MFEFGKFFVALLLAVVAWGEYEIKIYSDYDQRGEFITIDAKIPDLSESKEFLSRAKSFCVNSTNRWSAFRDTNYDIFLDAFTTCGNYNYFHLANSLRFLGPADTTIPAITVTSGSHGNVNGGRELIIGVDEATSFGFVPVRSIVLTGRSNWTLFFGENFSGVSWCYRGGDLDYSVKSLLHDFASVRKGC